MSLIVKVGKAGKRLVKKVLAPAEKHSISYTRRIERVKTTRRICAMTFDDGPMTTIRTRPVSWGAPRGAVFGMTIIPILTAIKEAVRNTVTV